MRKVCVRQQVPPHVIAKTESVSECKFFFFNLAQFLDVTLLLLESFVLI